MIAKPSSYPNADRGYTLIELMIIVTLVGIVSSIAYSAFTGYTRLADRSQAQADLYEIAQIMERGYTDSQDYTMVQFNSTALGTSATNLTFFNTRNPRYTFSVTAVAGPPSTYTAQAVTTTESRDTYDFQLNERGTESYRTSGTTAWPAANIGWDNIAD